MCDCYDFKTLSISSIVNFKPARLNDESWLNSSDSTCTSNSSECYDECSSDEDDYEDEHEQTESEVWISLYRVVKDAIMVY
jgi:Zn-dependent M28 family amino/carboxypeptidase